MKIKLNLELSSGQRLAEELMWDLSNPDNSPYEVALHLLSDLGRASLEDYLRVAQEIIAQIELYSSSLAVNMQRNVDAFISDCEDSFDPESQESSVPLLLSDFPLSTQLQVPPRKHF